MFVTKEKIKKLAKSIMIDLTDQQIEKLDNDFDIILQQMELVQQINTDLVEPMHFPIETSHFTLREDKVEDMLSQSEVLQNSPESQNGYIVINKVIK